MADERIIRNKIKKAIKPYLVELVGLAWNIQGTIDIELDYPIYYKEQEKMENKIREAVKPYIVNDIYYRERMSI